SWLLKLDRVPRVDFGTERFRYDDALESDLAAPAREITSRHRVDRRLLLPLAAPRDAVARNATSHIAPRNRHPYSAEKSKQRSVAVPAIIAVAVCTTGAARFGP